MSAQAAPKRDHLGVSAELAECLRRGLYADTAMEARCLAAGRVDSAEWTAAVGREAARMIADELEQWRANSTTWAEVDKLPNIRRKATGPRKSAPRKAKRAARPVAPTRVVLRPFDADAWATFQATGDVPTWVTRDARAELRRRMRDRARIESDAAYLVRVYPAEPTNIGAYWKADERKAAERAHARAMDAWRAECAELDAWRDGANLPEPTAPEVAEPAPVAPEPEPEPEPTAPEVVPIAELPPGAVVRPAVVECRPGEAPEPEPEPTHAVAWGERWGLRGYYVGIGAEPEPPGAEADPEPPTREVDTAPVPAEPEPATAPIPAEPTAAPAPVVIVAERARPPESDAVAEYLARLVHAPKRAFAEALLRGEAPADPGRPWADKVRAKLARMGAI